MPGDKKEPQSYGSQNDWLTGRTGQQPGRSDGTAGPEHEDFYADRRESETSAPNQGGRVSSVQRAESEIRRGTGSGEQNPVQKVADLESGAKRDGFFKRRDYEE